MRVTNVTLRSPLPYGATFTGLVSDPMVVELLASGWVEVKRGRVTA